MSEDPRFRERYGPWALVAGASEGLGEAFAHALARRGLDVIVVARRAEPLGEVAKRVAEGHGVRTHAAPMDLSRPDLEAGLDEAVGDREVGLVVYNAAYSLVGGFLSQDLAAKQKILDTNCRGPLVAAHRFGAEMAGRGRGGIVLMSSLSGMQGSPWVATYAASKAFDLVLAEALWDEFRPKGVDVLGCVAGATLTPGYLESRPESAGGLFAPPEMAPEDVVEEALAALGRRPSLIPGARNRFAAFVMTRLLPRRTAVATMGRATRSLYEK